MNNELSSSYEKLLLTLRDEFLIKLRAQEDNTPREAEFVSTKSKIKVAVGIRRAGKTTFMLQHIRELLAQGIAISRILYINLEDDRLLPMSQSQLASLIEAFYSLYPENHEQTCYLFFDEIQNVDDWALVVRRFFDTKPAEIFLTGSSAKLLSKEISTSLRGRSLATEIWPYSFKEYLHAKKISYPNSPLSQINYDKFKAYFIEYLKTGGFPDMIDQNPVERQQTLQEYVQVVMLRDILERHQIGNEALIKYLIKYLLHNCAAPYSANKIFNDLKSQGFAVNRDTIYQYLAHIEDAYLAFSIQVYSESIRKSQVNPKKNYAVDTGLVSAYTLKYQENLGRLFENVIYLDLRRRGYEINYYLTKERYEVDFIVKGLDCAGHLLQVCWEMNTSSTFEREHRALEIAKKETGLTGKIVTLETYLNDDWL